MRNQFHEALLQVQELRARIFDNRQFEGYSGIARGCGALSAIAGTMVLQSSLLPQTVVAHTVGWAAICVVAIFLNYGALTRWYLAQPKDNRELAVLRPVVDAVPAFVIGGVLSLALLAARAESLLQGMWMLIFGLMHTSSRHALPATIWWLGWYYIACGAWYLLFLEQARFTDPLPMGCVFGIGELAGAVIFYLHRKQLLKKEAA